MTESAIDAVVARFDPAHQDRVRHLIGIDDELAGYWGVIIPQPHLETLPEKLTRKCCTYKTCGNTELYLEDETEGVPAILRPFLGNRTHTYRRFSNDDAYMSGTRAEVLAMINDPYYFPIDEDADEIRRTEMRP